ncbi:MAG: hypothetical protein Q9195_007960 [Heterodermia aff. obscurata]
MRFLNTKTLQFEEVADSSLGEEQNKYAILSHRWGAVQDEISFADINESQDISNKKGFAKMKGFCDLAASLGYRYGWDDTCCINKGDSSELSEAINSMYHWYQGSSVCIVYLEDVTEKCIMDSAWFDRGWTLQELIAPTATEFYDRDWNHVQSKSHLVAKLCSKTGIPEDVLTGRASPSHCSIAQRMSWAARRKTTRVEDRAYCLLGIFDVSMPQIYGEREKAFLRLQRAISQQSKDESIFAWSMGLEKNEEEYTGLFAPSPLSYLHCGDVISTRGSTGFAETNGELSITLNIFPHSMNTSHATLNCTHIGNPESRIAILVSQLSTKNEYVRARKSLAGGRELIALSELEHFVERTIRIPLQPTELPSNTFYGFWLRTMKPPGHTESQCRILSRSDQTEVDKVCLRETECGTAGIIHFARELGSKVNYNDDPYERRWSKISWIKLGFDVDFNPMLFLARSMRWMVYRKDSLGVIPNAQLFEQATGSGPASRARKLILDNRWISGKAGVPSRSHGWSSGISILKVDRFKGVSGSLDALNLGILVKLRPSFSPEGSVSERKDEQIWVVDITDTERGDPERDMSKINKDLDQEEWMNCCCGGNPDMQSHAIQQEREMADSLRKVLDSSDLR